MGENLSRKRSHEQITAEDVRSTPAQANTDGHGRAGSASSRAESVSPHTRKIALQRDNAPTDAHGNFICKRDPVCSELAFARKCDWR